MASKINGNSILSDLTMNDLMDFMKRETMFSLNCHAIGKIQSFDKDTQTAQVGINYTLEQLVRDPKTNLYSSKYPAYPSIIDCPVLVMGGGGKHVTFPIAPGDDCLVLFNDRDFNNWFAGQNNAPPASARVHSYTDAIVIVGLHSLSNSIEGYEDSKAMFGNIAEAYILAGEKIKIANATQDLKTLLTSLCSELNSLTTALAALTVTGVTPGVGVSGVPANAAAITAIGTSISQISTDLGGLLE